jgi:hypothetical protein
MSDDSLELTDDEKLKVLYQRPFEAAFDYAWRTGKLPMVARAVVASYISYQGIQPTKEFKKHM